MRVAAPTYGVIIHKVAVKGHSSLPHRNHQLMKDEAITSLKERNNSHFKKDLEITWAKYLNKLGKIRKQTRW